jgi:glycosyltransferase involved in cell wall biosynthesis
MELGGFDLIHAHDWLVAYSAVALKYATHLPLVVTVHSMERGRSQGRLESEQALAINGTEWWLTFEAWRIITVSRFMGDQVHHYFEAPRDKIEIINNGVTPPVARLSPEESLDFRRRFASDGEALVFNVGRLVYEKGVHVLVDAAPQILAQYGPAKFVVAGTGSQEDMLRHRTVERGVEDAFTFTGFLPDEERDHLFDVAEVAVFPSLYEPFGIVALEAMAHRCPVVVAATGGLAEVVKLHETGMTSHPGSPDSLAWAVVETLRRRDWAIARANNAFDEVRALYSWPRIARETAAVYHRVRQEWRQSGWAQSRYE